MSARRRGGRVSKIVGEVFGLAELRPGQRAVIDAVLAKRHTLAIMPTGAGKSLCYQVFTTTSYHGRTTPAARPDQSRTNGVYAQTALCRTHVLLEALGETVESSQCGTCDNCRGLAIRSEAVAEGAA
jgi:superfamily II DNA helicase RecQ